MHSFQDKAPRMVEKGHHDQPPLVVSTKGLEVGVRVNPEFQAREEKVVAALVEVINALRDGQSVCFGAYPKGVYRQVTPIRVITGKAGRDEGIICESTRCDAGHPKNFLSLPVLSLIYFPAVSDVAPYFRAGAYSLFGGPSELYPGSVGMLQMLYDPQRLVAQVVALQSSVVHGKPSVKDILTQEDNNRPTRYFRWRHHLLDQAFNFTRREGISRIAIGPSDLADFPLSRMTRNHEMISEKALKNGFAFADDRMHLIDQLAGSKG